MEGVLVWLKIKKIKIEYERLKYTRRNMVHPRNLRKSDTSRKLYYTTALLLQYFFYKYSVYMYMHVFSHGEHGWVIH